MWLGINQRNPSQLGDSFLRMQANTSTHICVLSNNQHHSVWLASFYRKKCRMQWHCLSSCFWLFLKDLHCYHNSKKKKTTNKNNTNHRYILLKPSLSIGTPKIYLREFKNTKNTWIIIAKILPSITSGKLSKLCYTWNLFKPFWIHMLLIFIWFYQIEIMAHTTDASSQCISVFLLKYIFTSFLLLSTFPKYIYFDTYFECHFGFSIILMYHDFNSYKRPQ